MCRQCASFTRRLTVKYPLTSGNATFRGSQFFNVSIVGSWVRTERRYMPVMACHLTDVVRPLYARKSGTAQATFARSASECADEVGCCMMVIFYRRSRAWSS